LVSALWISSGCSVVAGLDEFRIEGGDAGGQADADPMTPGHDGCIASTFFRDADGDGIGGDSDTIRACVAPAGYVAASGDCDDTDETVRPDADEACNGVDDDCDDLLDEGLSPRETYFADVDGDGAGVEDQSVEACEPPDGFATNAGDCAPMNENVFPGASESCNGLDDDCDTAIDEGEIGPVGSPRTIASQDRRLVRVAADGAGYWIVYFEGQQPRLVQLDRTGEATGISVTWPDLPFPGYVALSVADTPAGVRPVVAWPRASSVFAAAVDPDAPEATAPVELGAAGETTLPAIVAVGPRILATWISGSGTNLRVRQFDPVANSATGDLLSEPVSESGVGTYLIPSLTPTRDLSGVWVGFPAQQASDSDPAAYLASVAVGGSPTWLGIAARTAPYASVQGVYLGSVADGRLPTLVAGETGVCMQVASIDGSDLMFSTACNPVPGSVSSAPVRRGGGLTVLVRDSTSRLAVIDLADGPGTDGGAFVEIAPRAAPGGDLAFIDEGEGLAVYAVGDTPPYELMAQPIGCE
jgi:hypothetical protein